MSDRIRKREEKREAFYQRHWKLAISAVLIIFFIVILIVIIKSF